MLIIRYLIVVLVGLALMSPYPAWADKVQKSLQSAARNYFRQAMMLGTDGKDEEALRALQQAVSCDANFYEAYSMMGSSLERLGRYSEAEAALRRAVQIKPDYVEGHYYLGVFLQERGRTQEAEQAFQKAKQLQR